MSMKMLTIFQTIWVAAAYLAVTAGLPWLLLRSRLRHMKLPEKFMACLVSGSSFCTGLVLVLQLLHISNRATLITGTLLPFLAALSFKHRQPALSVLERGLDGASAMAGGGIGMKTVLLRTRNRAAKLSSGWAGKWLAPRWLDVLLSLLAVCLVLYMYGTNTVNVYGYCASDVVVHNYWINAMDSNQIFVSGVYPFGLHCIVYYLHAVFGIPVYVLLRVFPLVQALMAHMVLLAFLKMACRSRYTPYAGMAAYILSGAFYQYAYMRYYAPLPQEYGMLFILPATWFATAFLKEKDFVSVGRKRLASAGSAKASLILFAISVSMTLTAHFYDTMVAGMLCIGLAIGFCYRCFRWRYLHRLLIAGTAGILIAVLPMAAAYAMGKPLEGSLYWGMHVLSAPGTEADVDAGSGADGGDAVQEAPEKEAVLEAVISEMQYYVTNNDRDVAVFMLGGIAVLFVLGILWHILRRGPYAAVLVAVSTAMGILCLFQAAGKLGLPQLMEVSRYAMYIGYGMAATWSLCLDAAVYLLFQERRGINGGGAVALAASCIAIAATGTREPSIMNPYESNGAVACLTNILREDKGTWTICSANDERTMIGGEGYHYELIDFLSAVEGGDGGSLTIPTDTVYFFIEKEPVYYRGAMGTFRPEWHISEEDACKPLAKGGISAYTEEDRVVTMSHIYYWAEAFRELYPNEMEVYYESDSFLCYRIRQDGYCLYDFAIGYGYHEDAETEAVR